MSLLMVPLLVCSHLGTLQIVLQRLKPSTGLEHVVPMVTRTLVSANKKMGGYWTLEDQANEEDGVLTYALYQWFLRRS